MRWITMELLLFSLFLAGSLPSFAFCKRLCLPRLGAELPWLHGAFIMSLCSSSQFGALAVPGVAEGKAAAPMMQSQDTQSIWKELNESEFEKRMGHFCPHSSKIQGSDVLELINGLRKTQKTFSGCRSSI